MKYSDIQQQRRRAEKLINRAMHHAKEGQNERCAEFIEQANKTLSLISTGISNGEKDKGDDLNLLKVARLAMCAGVSWPRVIESLIKECEGSYIPAEAGTGTIRVPSDRVDDFRALVREIAPVTCRLDVEAIKGESHVG